MSFLSSPGVHVREIDLTNIVPAVATTVGALAMPAQKGPSGSIITVGSEQDLLSIYGKPNASTPKDFLEGYKSVEGASKVAPMDRDRKSVV
jgi:hypothetical protein